MICWRLARERQNESWLCDVNLLMKSNLQAGSELQEDQTESANCQGQGKENQLILYTLSPLPCIRGSLWCEGRLRGPRDVALLRRRHSCFREVRNRRTRFVRSGFRRRKTWKVPSLSSPTESKRVLCNLSSVNSRKEMIQFCCECVKACDDLVSTLYHSVIDARMVFSIDFALCSKTFPLYSR